LKDGCATGVSLGRLASPRRAPPSTGLGANRAIHALRAGRSHGTAEDDGFAIVQVAHVLAGHGSHHTETVRRWSSADKESERTFAALEPGTALVARYKKQDRTCEVVKTEDGLRHRLDDRSEHNSPSSAGKAAMGGVACNGWRFWALQGTEPRKPKAEKPATAQPKKAPAKAAPKAKGKKAAKGKSAKKPNALRMAARADSYGCCGACGESFRTMKAAIQHALMHTE
jgi:hypothetical protein